ncbi:amino acid ABC transporter permease [Uliginosibacterium sp. 31-12]|uniref:amino acid ABC transporter permease n=1 Tax=Uliginosibacterium sp. 31-12 TaxID=3062781 RepID=UPI0026E31926|nr:ABC transporter permease subunit [Uliginosibacterium sp. 31-12]MDO6385180.1 ABC transporter permease subunit [Uliginosibacterium sp. 31-12]
MLRPLLRWLPQILLLCLLALLLGWLGHNVLEHMRERGIRAGFDFLLDPAGFEIGEGLLAYDASQPMWRAFLTGSLNTLRVALPAILLATLLGILIGLGRLAEHPLPRRLCGALVETLRNIPLLLQLLICYFALTGLLPEASNALAPFPGVLISKGGLFLPALDCSAACSLDVPLAEGFGISGGWSLSPEFLAVLIALSLYSAVFIAEIVRGGIQSVAQGQIDAARALGMRPLQVLREVVFPLALRAIVPPMGNQYLNLIKNSSLAVAVGYPELVSVANTSLNQTGRAFECIVIVMAVYLTLSLITAALVNLYNARVALRGTR